jgi:23S rRNA (adenine2503-C2)-methyltransferase
MHDSGEPASTRPAVSLTAVGQSVFNQRFIAEVADGARVECVLYRGDTLCISSQVGCGVGCPFCASGSRGLARPLSYAELTGQIEAVQRMGHALARVTVSGVGEPLHNHAAVWSLLELCQRTRIGLSLTTSGGPLARLAQWLHAPHNGLTLSVHAGTELVRARMVPKGPSLGELFELLTSELPRMSRRRRKKTALAYLLCADQNDGEQELAAFAARALPLGLRVHLYAYNEVASSQFRRTARVRYEAAYRQLTAAGLHVHMSSQARLEDNGGCGTLVARFAPSRNGNLKKASA